MKTERGSRCKKPPSAQERFHRRLNSGWMRAPLTLFCTVLHVFNLSMSASVPLQRDRRQMKSGMEPKTPKLQSISRHAIGMPRTWPAIRARGITPAHAMEAEGYNKLVSDRIDVRSNEGYGNDKVGKCQPVSAVGKKGMWAFVSKSAWLTLSIQGSRPVDCAAS